MKTFSPERNCGLAIALVALFFSFGFAAAGQATPADEITQAVATAGAANVKQADSELFLNAVESVLVGVDPDATAPYIEAATKLRPDLSAQITAAATDVESASDDAESPDRRVSGHRRRVRICCRGHTLVLSPHQAIFHLLHHPHECHVGACHGHPRIHNPLEHRPSP